MATGIEYDNSRNLGRIADALEKIVVLLSHPPLIVSADNPLPSGQHCQCCDYYGLTP